MLGKDSKIQLVLGKAGQYFGHTESIFCDFGKSKTVCVQNLSLFHQEDHLDRISGISFES